MGAATLHDELYRIQEAARILKVHRSTIYRMRDDGDFVFTYVRGAPRIPREQIERALQARGEGDTIRGVNSLDERKTS